MTAKTTRAARPRATRDSKTHTTQYNSRDTGAQRSADNWLLDAAVHAHDGDRRNARLAALRGLRVLGFRVRSC